MDLHSLLPDVPGSCVRKWHPDLCGGSGVKCRVLSSCGAWASHCGAWAPGAWALGLQQLCVAHRLSSCDSQAPKSWPSSCGARQAVWASFVQPILQKPLWKFQGNYSFLLFSCLLRSLAYCEVQRKHFCIFPKLGFLNKFCQSLEILG